jgi:chitin disaccharide deacetylase
MRIHVHSDDLGGTEAASADILDTWEAGGLDSFSILPNGAGLAFARDRLRRSGDRPARISVHLNLSEGRSISPPVDVPLLVGSDGALTLGFERLLLTWLRSSKAGRAELARQVGEEWRAQVDVVKRTIEPRTIAALDSHRHVHMLPFLFPVAAAIALDEGIAGIRISRETAYVASPADLLRPFFWANVVKHAALRVCAVFARSTARRSGLSAPDRLVGVLYTGHMTERRARAGIRAASRSSANETEVVFHVGRAEPAGRPGEPFAGAFYTSSLRTREGREAILLSGILRRRPASE